MGGAISSQASTTNGDFVHGYGIKTQGQAGVSIAKAKDALAAANNPAGTVWIGDRLDIGATLFSADRSAEIEGNAAGAKGKYDANQKKYFLLPKIGYNKPLNERLGAGIAVYGNGGMNTDYKHTPYGAFGNTGSAGWIWPSCSSPPRLLTNLPSASPSAWGATLSISALPPKAWAPSPTRCFPATRTTSTIVTTTPLPVGGCAWASRAG